MLKEKITIEMLTQDNVSILTQSFIDNNETIAQVGENYRTTYRNTERERTLLIVLPQNVQESILAMWGTTPTVIDNREI